MARPLRLEPFRALRVDPAAVAAVPTSAATSSAGAAQRLADLQAAGQIGLDDLPGLHLHEYRSGDVTVRGLVGALDLRRRTADVDDRAVLPHEGVHRDQVTRLAAQMAELDVDPAPILLVHRGEPALRRRLAAVRADPPRIQFADPSGQSHRLWRLHDAELLTAVSESLARTRALVADGHHRYAAYLQLAREAAQRPASGLAMIVDHDDTPLTLRPIHRVLRGVSLGAATEAATAAGLRVGGRQAPGPARGIRLVGVEGEWLASLHDGDARTEVEVLHADVIPLLPTASVVTTPDLVSARQEAARADTVAALLPAVGLEQVLATARRGDLLPEKATSFEPKPALGVLMRSRSDG